VRKAWLRSPLCVSTYRSKGSSVARHPSSFPTRPEQQLIQALALPQFGVFPILQHAAFISEGAVDHSLDRESARKSLLRSFSPITLSSRSSKVPYVHAMQTLRVTAHDIAFRSRDAG
jgi:hypothetical protein